MTKDMLKTAFWFALFLAVAMVGRAMIYPTCQPGEVVVRDAGHIWPPLVCVKGGAK